MVNPSIILETKSLPVPAIKGRGRKVGSGANIKLLERMAPGQSIWEVPKEKMESIRATAHNKGIEITVRRQPNSIYYAIWRK